MSDCSLINKNSKLYQKFLENKGRRELQPNIGRRETLQNSKHRCMSNLNPFDNEIITKQRSTSMSLCINNDENVDSSNFSQNTIQEVAQQDLNELLKKELERSRTKMTIKEHRVERLQVKEKQKVLSRLEESYLATQVQRLSDRLAKQIDRNGILAQALKKQSHQLQKLERQLQITKKSLHFAQEQAKVWKKRFDQLSASIDHQQKDESLARQMQKLREQNYLAKDYLYKLTLKLYQSEQQNQKLKSQINHMPSSCNFFQSGLRPSPSPQPQTNQIKMVRHRQFTTHRNERFEENASYHTEVAKDIIQPSTQSPKYQRITQIKQQLQALNELKVFNGKNRRRKIELERQLQQLTHS